MKPLITFVNHASVIFSYGDVNLITDPWISGSAFNNSWELISKSKMQIKDFEIFNICSSRPIKLSKVVNLLNRLTNVPKIKKIFGW